MFWSSSSRTIKPPLGMCRSMLLNLFIRIVQCRTNEFKNSQKFRIVSALFLRKPFSNCSNQVFSKPNDLLTEKLVLHWVRIRFYVGLSSVRSSSCLFKCSSLTDFESWKVPRQIGFRNWTSIFSDSVIRIWRTDLFDSLVREWHIPSLVETFTSNNLKMYILYQVKDRSKWFQIESKLDKARLRIDRNNFRNRLHRQKRK